MGSANTPVFRSCVWSPRWLRYLGAAELVGLASRFRIGEGVHQGRGHVRHLQSGTSASVAPLFPNAVWFVGRVATYVERLELGVLKSTDESRPIAGNHTPLDQEVVPVVWWWFTHVSAPDTGSGGGGAGVEDRRTGHRRAR